MKRLIAVLLIVIMCVGFSACGTYYASLDEYDDNELKIYGFVIIKQLGRYGESACYLVYDSVTKVEYIVCQGSYSNLSVCPYYDENGNIVIYGGK
jgi:hypothetical protein